MNTTNTPNHEELHRVANRFAVTPLLRNQNESINDYLTRVQEEFPIDLPTYQQEALLEFAETHGAYPPVLILAEQPQLVESWHNTLSNHREQHGARTITKQLAEHHDLIMERLAADVPVHQIATELNCASKNLRDYIRRTEAAN